MPEARQIPAIYINLDRVTARRGHMEAQAAKVGIELQRMSAVDGKALAPEDIARLRGSGGTHELAAPEIACCLSHFAAWKWVAEGEDEWGCIFEDDILMAEDLGLYLKDRSWIPPTADVLKLETFCRRTLVVPPFRKLPTDRVLGRLMWMHLGAAGYILKRDFARKLVASERKWGALPDQVLFNPEYRFVRDYEIWQVYPALCVQQINSETRFLPEAAGDSSLMTFRQKDRRKGLAKVWRELTRPIQRLPKSTYVAAKVVGGAKWGLVPFRETASGQTD